MFIFLCYSCYDPDYEIEKKTHMHVWKCKQQEFLVLPLRSAHVRTSRNFNRMISLKISRSSCSPNRATVCNKRHPRCVVSHEYQRKGNKEAGGLSCLHSNSAWLS